VCLTETQVGVVGETVGDDRQQTTVWGSSMGWRTDLAFRTSGQVVIQEHWRKDLGVVLHARNAVMIDVAEALVGRLDTVQKNEVHGGFAFPRGRPMRIQPA